MISKWFQCVIYHIVFRCFCSGVITLAPRIVPWENEKWILECSLDSIVSTVSIQNPSSSTVGTCDPTSGPFTASCTPTAGYTFAINETSNIVSMNLTVSNSETGIWTCLHSTDSATYNLQSPLPSRHLAASLSSYKKHFMSVPAGTELTRGTVYNFSAHCGCMSATLKFVWTTVPGSSSEDISNTSSPSFTCTTKSAYMSTIDATASILQSVTSRGTTLKVSVYVEGYYDLPSSPEYTYDVTFSPSSENDGGSDESSENDGGSDENLYGLFGILVVVLPSCGAYIYIFKKKKLEGIIPNVYVKTGCTIKWDAAIPDKSDNTNPEWTKNGKKLKPITISTSEEKMLIDKASIQDEGLYICILNRKMTQLMYNIIVIETVYSVMEGGAIKLGAEVEGPQIWTIQGKSKQSADTGLLISKASKENEGLYMCTVQWEKVPLKYYLIVEGSEETVYVEKGSDIEFGKSIVTTVSWNKEEKPFRGQQTLGSNILIQEASEKDGGVYYCTIESNVQLKYILIFVDSKKNVEDTNIKDREATSSSTTRSDNAIVVSIQI